jgi:hypothetical protein
VTEEPPTEPEATELRAFRIWSGGDGVVRVAAKPEVAIAFQDAKECVAAVTGVSGGRRPPFSWTCGGPARRTSRPGGTSPGRRPCPPRVG